MNMKRFLLYFLFAVLVIFTGCSEEIAPTPYTYSKFFTGENSKTWKIKILEETLDGEVIDRFTLACATDDRYTFFAETGNPFHAVTGINRCSPTEKGLIEDVWTFNNANATLTMVLPFFGVFSPLPFIVREVDNDGMELEIFLDEANTSSYRIHFDLVSED